MRFDQLDGGRAAEAFERAMAEAAQHLSVRGGKCKVTTTVTLTTAADSRVRAGWQVVPKLAPPPVHESVLFLAESAGKGGEIVAQLCPQDPAQRPLFPAEVVKHPSASEAN